jgi:membrane protease YdiL (CAAX protease family)
LNQLVIRHPYLGTLIFFITFLLCILFVRILLLPVYRGMHLPFLQSTLIGEILMALIAVMLISSLGWWSETGFTYGLTSQGLVVCLVPTLLIILPRLGLPMLVKGVPVSVTVTAVILALLVGFVEEGFFRGLILRTLLPKGILLSTMLSSVLFACMHLTNLLHGFPWPYVVGQMLDAFGIGVLFAALRLRTGSIWPTLLLHAVYDVGGLILLSINPQIALSIPLNRALISSSIVCLLFLLNAWYLLRPSKLRLLRAFYGLSPALPTSS